MTAALLFALQEQAIGWDPVSVHRDYGPVGRAIILAMLVMACWVAVSGLRAIWGRLRRSQVESERILRRTRNLKLIGQTAPMIGLLGTTIELIFVSDSISIRETLGWGVVSNGVSEALGFTAIGLATGIAAHFVAAFVESAQPSKD